jgi:hypothetical protein
MRAIHNKSATPLLKDDLEGCNPKKEEKNMSETTRSQKPRSKEELNESTHAFVGRCIKAMKSLGPAPIRNTRENQSQTEPTE